MEIDSNLFEKGWRKEPSVGGQEKSGVCVDEGMGGDPSPYLACQWAVAAFECGEQRLRVQNALDFFAGGLAEEVDDKVLHAAFIPFGDITDIQIPLDYETGGSFGCL